MTKIESLKLHRSAPNIQSVQNYTYCVDNVITSIWANFKETDLRWIPASLLKEDFVN